MIKGYVFDRQKYPAAPFAKTLEEILNHNEGFVDASRLSYTNNSITLDAGNVIVKGRAFSIIENETIAIDPTQSGELYCVLIFEIDLSKESSSSTFKQVEMRILTSAIDYPSLTKQDINSEKEEDIIYQYEIAKFKNTTTGIQGFKDNRTFLDFDNMYTKVLEEIKNIRKETETTTSTFIMQLFEELESVKSQSDVLLKTGGVAGGDFTFNGNITVNNISNTSRK